MSLDPNRRPVTLWTILPEEMNPTGKNPKMGVPGMVKEEFPNGDILISHYCMGPLETLIKKADVEERLTFHKPNPLLNNL